MPPPNRGSFDPMPNHPRFAFIIPTFNRSTLLEESVRSILEAASSRAIEIIVVDDGSTDSAAIASLSLLERWNINVVRTSGGNGPAGARNIGISLAAGEWICFLDSDDIAAPDSIDARSEAIDRYPEISWFSGGLDYINRTTRVRAQEFDSISKYDPQPQTPGYYFITHPLEAIVELSMPFQVGCMTIRRTLLRSVGGFCSDLTYGEEWHLWMKLASKENFVHLNRSLIGLRREGHDSLMGAPLRRAAELHKSRALAINDPQFKSVRRQLSWRISSDLRLSARIFKEHNHKYHAAKSLVRALRYCPSDTRILHDLMNIWH